MEHKLRPRLVSTIHVPVLCACMLLQLPCPCPPLHVSPGGCHNCSNSIKNSHELEINLWIFSRSNWQDSVGPTEQGDGDICPAIAAFVWSINLIDVPRSDNAARKDRRAKLFQFVQYASSLPHYQWVLRHTRTYSNLELGWQTATLVLGSSLSCMQHTRMASSTAPLVAANPYAH